MKTSKGQAIAYWTSTSLFTLNGGPVRPMIPMTNDGSRTWPTHL
jgi:hypothetical protein